MWSGGFIEGASSGFCSLSCCASSYLSIFLEPVAAHDVDWSRRQLHHTISTTFSKRRKLVQISTSLKALERQRPPQDSSSSSAAAAQAGALRKDKGAASKVMSWFHSAKRYGLWW